MKKIILLSLPIFVLAWCGSSSQKVEISWQTKQVMTDESKPLVNVEKKTKKAEQVLKKVWLTGEKLKQEIAKQKKWFEIISKLKWDERKKYIIETEILPQIIKLKKVNPKCKSTNLNNYVSCLYLTKTPIEKLLEQVPNETKTLIKKTYYYKVYSLDKKKLLEKTSDPIALEMKKEKIKQMVQDGILKNPNVCNKLPEEEIKDFCKGLFE